MHYSKLLKGFSDAACATASETTVKTADEVSADFAQMFKEFTERFKPCEAPADVEDTNLDDEAINDVLSRLLDLQEKYFPDIPLSNELCKKFMWNIPRHVYEASKRVQLYGEPDVLDPIFFFYIFCVGELDTMTLGKFVCTVLNSVDEDDYVHITTLNGEYDNCLKENENDD